ncbi:MAG: hypothetical protein KIPDCIKN_01379 [Haliscomenobacter sp.]|nr:hypothetical protein [Haliscomenobacter sp.]
MNTINDEGLVKLFDSLAIVMTLSDDPGRFDVGWMNLKQHTNLNLEEYDEFVEARDIVVDDIKDQIAEIIMNYHRTKYGYNYREAQYEFKGDRYNYPDGKYYEQRFYVEIDDHDQVRLLDAEFDLKNTYVDLLKEDVLPVVLK